MDLSGGTAAAVLKLTDRSLFLDDRRTETDRFGQTERLQPEEQRGEEHREKGETREREIAEGACVCGLVTCCYILLWVCLYY